MRYRNHMLINLSAALWLNASLGNTGAMVLSSVFPDIVDHLILSERNWWKEHRGLSHFWLVYVAGCAVLYIFIPLELSGYVLYFTLGCLLHIFMDFLTPVGVPVFTLRERRSVFLFKTGSFTETLFALSFFLLTVYLRGRGWLETQLRC